MQLGMAGYRATGKTTVFNCLTGSTATTGLGGSRDANRGVIKVPDPRIDALSAIFEPKKTTFADVSFVDLPGPQEEGGIDKNSAAELRTMDALVHVVRGFGEEGGVPARGGSVDAVRDLCDFDAELTMLDHVILDGRQDRLRREGKPSRERDAIEKMLAGLQDGDVPARRVDMDEAEMVLLSGFQLLSLKPQIALLNLPDDIDASEVAALELALREVAAPRGIEIMSLRGNIECEISQLSAEDQASFLEDLGLSEAATGRFIQACYSLLDLISFFTVGEDEVRAWTIDRGTPAVRAAGKIHSDLERGFIRAETVSYDDFMNSGKKLSAAKQAGKMRLEGKDYIVSDGDIINVRFNV
jgi:GTP-binding protein YchF